MFAGMAGFPWLALWMPFYSAPEKSPCVSDSELAHILADRDDIKSNSQGHFAWWRLFAFRETRGLCGYKVFDGPVSWFWLIWLPDFHLQRHLYTCISGEPPFVAAVRAGGFRQGYVGEAIRSAAGNYFHNLQAVAGFELPLGKFRGSHGFAVVLHDDTAGQKILRAEKCFN